MLYADIKLKIEGKELDDAELQGIEISEAVVALEEALPELPEGADWKVEY